MSTNSIGSLLFGDGRQPGLLGTGQMDVAKLRVNSDLADLPDEGRTLTAIQAERNSIRDRVTPTVEAARLDGTQQGAMREAQAGLVSDLQAASRGEGPSAAQEQLTRGVDANLAATVAAANTARGMGGAGATRDLLATQAATRQEGAGQAATLRAQEIAEARGHLAAVSGQARAQDLQLAEQNAVFEQQANLANQQAELNARAQADDYMRSLLALGHDMQNAQRLARIKLEELRVQGSLERDRIRLGTYNTSGERRYEVTKATANAIGQAMGMGF